MSSKRKSQPTRIRDQIEDSELRASPIHSPNTQLEKGMLHCSMSLNYQYPTVFIKIKEM